ncbi:F0F1 ATP synthase subunit epsilon [Pseudonocardia sp. RS11V-5]|uniref:F0F1 ATP synthase subunit epsilon n=1 Tax=Pseudonocardia terrae TaxID=2905831 RepID=UPI001E479A58|nr:F0F1 ATP synthase subunit epsilon [Pseudonocardia terrae]MCE3553727.1 F0F1 ATP synthase subunit epsilon [Pseudonocardia terrae]
MAEMTVELVAVERRLWSGKASFVLARTTEGEIGILPGHEFTLAQLEEAGVVRIDPIDSASLTVAVHGGFLSVTPAGVSILAEFAELAEEIDVSRARAALDRADTSDAEGAAAHKRAEVRLQAAESASAGQ